MKLIKVHQMMGIYSITSLPPHDKMIVIYPITRHPFKATKKFQALEERGHLILCNVPQSGRVTFRWSVLPCLRLFKAQKLRSSGASGSGHSARSSASEQQPKSLPTMAFASSSPTPKPPKRNTISKKWRISKPRIELSWRLLLAKLFTGINSIKAAYVELQTTQDP